VNLSLDIRSLREAAEKIEAAKKTLATSAMETRLGDYAAYSENRGHYYGLQEALMILQEVEKRLSK
jgi:hypothetical protein